MNYKKLTEEDLKSNVVQDFFKNYRYRQLGRIDFVIAKQNTENKDRQRFLFDDDDDIKSILWAEAKQGSSHDIFESFVQLILTIGKEKTFEKYLPPKYIGAFDAEKFAFIEYSQIQEIFYQNDFNWNVTPSNHEAKEFKQLYELSKNSLEENSIIFKYETQEKEFKEFIKLNFKTIKDITEKISVTKNNFTFVFQRWSEIVKPTITVDWQKANKIGIISADFFLADLLSENNESIKDNLYVVLKKTKYELAKKVDDLGFESSMSVGFNDNQKSYKGFWAIYSRPPKEEYWNYIIGRRDLLVPQDIRERKGSFFTPQIWVQKSQEYLADVLGESWQDEYFIWDCCAGTGNLLNGLANYDNVWASTIDKADVDVMVDRVNNGWGMPEDHIFQFDFLNDDFSKCPEDLQEILKNDEKRKKLVIYINPPYAEAGNKKQTSGTGKNKESVASETQVYKKYSERYGTSTRELFVQFLIRIFEELNNCVIGEFSKLKHLSSHNFSAFRNYFLAKLEKSFVVPANTFDNVSGVFPIGFFVWNLKEKVKFEQTVSDIFEIENKQPKFVGQRIFYSYDNDKPLLNWIQKFYDKENEIISYLRVNGQDFANNSGVFLSAKLTDNDLKKHFYFNVTKNNILEMTIYFVMRILQEQSWLNDRDQFLYPNDNWKSDKTFQSNCLIYTLFHGQNRISSEQGDNHWIPFTREQVGCKKSFKSNFMSKFLNGQIETSTEISLFENGETKRNDKIVLSKEAQAVYDSGLELWKYYHLQPNANPNAAFYDIKKYFQGETNGRMNNTSADDTYNELISDLRAKMKMLAKKIESKVYEYGFLK